MNGIFIPDRTCVSKFPSRFAGAAAAIGLMMYSSVANASETAFIFNTFSFLLWGALVMWMCAGFTMLEAGSVRTKNVSVICLKNIGLYAITGIAYYTIGYNLMYVDMGDFIGTFTLFYGSTENELALLAVLNGAIAGLVSITAGPDIVDHQWAIVIGGIGGLISTVGLKLLEFFKVDDGVGAIPAHLFAGIWGTIAVCIAAGGNLGVQLIGIVAIGTFVFGSSFVLWTILKAVMGVRVTQTVEELGQDLAALGIEAYPEFMYMPDHDDFGDFAKDK